MANCATVSRIDPDSSSLQQNVASGAYDDAVAERSIGENTTSCYRLKMVDLDVWRRLGKIEAVLRIDLA